MWCRVAAKHNAYRCCQELLKQSWVDPNRGKNKTTPLCAAAAAGAAEAVSVLLADGRANPRLARMDGVTPLLIATQQRHLGIMRMLLEDRRTQSNARALYPLRITPLLLTLRASDPSTMHLLLNLGQDLDLEANSFQRQTPLQICRELGCPPSMQRMLLDFAATGAVYDDLSRYLGLDSDPAAAAAALGSPQPPPGGASNGSASHGSATHGSATHATLPASQMPEVSNVSPPRPPEAASSASAAATGASTASGELQERFGDAEAALTSAPAPHGAWSDGSGEAPDHRRRLRSADLDSPAADPGPSADRALGRSVGSRRIGGSSQGTAEEGVGAAAAEEGGTWLRRASALANSNFSRGSGADAHQSAGQMAPPPPHQGGLQDPRRQGRAADPEQAPQPALPAPSVAAHSGRSVALLSAPAPTSARHASPGSGRLGAAASWGRRAGDERRQPGRSDEGTGARAAAGAGGPASAPPATSLTVGAVLRAAPQAVQRVSEAESRGSSPVPALRGADPGAGVAAARHEEAPGGVTARSSGRSTPVGGAEAAGLEALVAELETENAAFRRKNAMLSARVLQLEDRLQQIQQLATPPE